MKPTVLTLAGAMLLAGCGTIDGLGRDISAGAQRVQSWF
jgi:predicted small secreted protein